MAYINFKLLRKKGLTMTDYTILQCCKQAKFEDLSEELMEFCNEDVEQLLKYEDSGLIKFVKGKAKDTFFQRARLSKEGETLMANLEAVDATEEDIVIWDWLANIYKKNEKDIGNSRKGKMYLAQFRAASGIDRNRLSFLCSKFIKDESRMEYSHRLDYVFFKPPNIHAVKFDLEESKLWKYYLQSREFFDKRFEEILEKEENN